MGLVHLRPVGDGDEPFLYDVFCTTWENEVAALPNPSLAQHVLRIQYTAQERRFTNRYPGLHRYVVMHGEERVGRTYLLRTDHTIHLVDTTLLPQFRGQGLGTHLVRQVLDEARANDQNVTLRVPRRNERARALYLSLGFSLLTSDDLDYYLEWHPEDEVDGCSSVGDVAAAGSTAGSAS